jgi:hypothetical protein
LEIALGVSQIQAILDPLQPALYAVESSRLTGKVTVQVGYLAAQAGNRDLQRREALLHLTHVLPNFTYIGTDTPQVLENEIVRIVGHGYFFYACVSDGSIYRR